MVNTTSKLLSPRPASYKLKMRRTAANGEIIESTMTSNELNSITPCGKPVTASREEIINVLTNAAKKIKRQNSTIPEAAGAVRMKSYK